VLLLGLVVGGAACTAEPDVVVAEEDVPVAASQDPAVTVDDLVALDAAGLEAAFAAGRAPERSELAGDYVGVVLDEAPIHDDDLLGHGIRSVLDASHYGPWLEKHFGRNGVGENRYVPYDREIRTASFQFGPAVSLADGNPALVLDYARHDNLFLLWGVKEELRAVGRGVYLGHSTFETGGGRTTLFTYVLTRRP
jgi:hypothetical protein